MKHPDWPCFRGSEALVPPPRWHTACTVLQYVCTGLGGSMRKYAIAWLLGVPLSVLAVIYFFSNVAC